MIMRKLLYGPGSQNITKYCTYIITVIHYTLSVHNERLKFEAEYLVPSAYKL